MPWYDYRCKNCGRIHEREFPVSNIPGQVKCPDCGDRCRRIPSRTSFTISGYTAKNGYSKAEKP